MTELKVFTAEHNDPWFNLATEDWLFKTALPNQHILFLWRNKPCIVIGRFQNPWNECNLPAMEKAGVVLARRQSGGGAVYHDLGNTNFTFISPAADYDIDRNFTIITKSLKEFGIDAVQSGRNDILVADKKVSGSAFRKTSKRAFHHGTLLINSEMEKMPNYLTPDKDKLKSKGIRSVASRVANLTEFAPELTHDSLCDAIVKTFFTTYGQTAEIEDLSIERLSKIETLYKKYQSYADWKWRFGSTPQFAHPIKGRFSWGGITLDFDVQNGSIESLTIFSDALSVEFIEFLQSVLPGTPYALEAITNVLKQGSKTLPPEMIGDVISLIAKEFA